MLVEAYKIVGYEVGVVCEIWLEERLEDAGGAGTVKIKSVEMVEEVTEFGDGVCVVRSLVTGPERQVGGKAEGASQ